MRRWFSVSNFNLTSNFYIIDYFLSCFTRRENIEFFEKQRLFPFNSIGFTFIIMLSSSWLTLELLLILLHPFYLFLEPFLHFVHFLHKSFLVATRRSFLLFKCSLLSSILHFFFSQIQFFLQRVDLDFEFVYFLVSFINFII